MATPTAPAAKLPTPMAAPKAAPPQVVRIVKVPTTVSTSTRPAAAPTSVDRADQAPSSSGGNVSIGGATNPPITVLPTTSQRIVLHAIGGSGIAAVLTARDDGTTLTTTGVASGFQLGASYVSLWYGNGSSAAGTNQCASDRTLTLPQMLIGVWTGNRLVGEQTGPVSGVRLGQIGAVSIRQVSPQQALAIQTALAAGRSPVIAPTLLGLQACGAV